ncbi:hypothetical protein GSB9_01614 [Flavobacteriaceae bacterium GSB9]|nr:hypothetical protein GSB9_01614 [Flavobacteriaceae bacterium GSB9]
MKKLKVFIGFLIGFVIFSCSSESNDQSQQLAKEELLVQGSPWTFEHYKMINLIDAGNSTMTQQEIETKTNLDVSGNQISFSQNGTGFTSINGNTESIWEWEIIKQNQLKIIFCEDEFEIYDNLTVSSNELMIVYEAATYDPDAEYEVLHNGKYFYN